MRYLHIDANDGISDVEGRRGVRTGKQPWSDEEQVLVSALHARYGNRWSSISAHLSGRSENDVKNLFHSTIRIKCSSRRSTFLHTYVTAVKDCCDDAQARREAYKRTQKLCGGDDDGDDALTTTPATSSAAGSGGGGLQHQHHSLSPPLPLPPNLWIETAAARDSVDSAGWSGGGGAAVAGAPAGAKGAGPCSPLAGWSQELLGGDGGPNSGHVASVVRSWKSEGPHDSSPFVTLPPPSRVSRLAHFVFSGLPQPQPQPAAAASTHQSTSWEALCWGCATPADADALMSDVLQSPGHLQEPSQRHHHHYHHHQPQHQLQHQEMYGPDSGFVHASSIMGPPSTEPISAASTPRPFSSTVASAAGPMSAETIGSGGGDSSSQQLAYVHGGGTAAAAIGSSITGYSRCNLLGAPTTAAGPGTAAAVSMGTATATAVTAMAVAGTRSPLPEVSSLTCPWAELY